jgi:DNA invertase Pin-like site-specific DNA recombinase
LSAVLHFEPLVANAQLSKSSASYFCNDVYKAGMESARRQGRIGGRPRKLRPQEQAEIITMVSRGKKTAADAARIFGVHRSTVSRLLANARMKTAMARD